VPDGSLPGSTTAEGQTEDTDESVSEEAKSVEEVEAIWRNRMSGKDKAHAAESKALRDRIAALEAKQEASPKQGDGADPREAEIERLKQELEQTKVMSAIETRKAKYPFASDSLDDETLARMDEARLAGLNARLGTESEPQRGTFTDPNAAQRRTQKSTSPTEKSADDLKSDLRKMSPGFVSDLFGG
jgi:hypothetical protein